MSIDLLNPLLGRWASEGETVSTPDEPSVRIIGTDFYRRLGEHFIEHRVHVSMGSNLVEVVELIGEFDGEGYTMRSFDNSGAVGTMRATVDRDGVMTFAAATTRARLHVARGGQTMQAEWERRADEKSDWIPWMQMRFTRIEAPSWSEI